MNLKSLIDKALHTVYYKVCEGLFCGGYFPIQNLLKI